MTKQKIIIVGKAASGKDYLRALMAKRGFKPAVSFTTRPPRTGEIPNVTYNYVDEVTFINNRDAGAFFECVEFNGWFYGYTKVQWNTKDVFIMTPSGIAQIPTDDRKQCFVIYLDIPIDVRRERLTQRSDDADSVERRIAADEADFDGFIDYDIRITNDTF